MSGTIIAIAGCTNSGKSTLRERLKDQISSSFPHYKIASLAQDDFFKKKQNVRQLKHNSDPCITFFHYDEAEAIDEKALREELKRLTLLNNLIIVDGNMLTELPSILSLIHTIVFVTLDFKTCKERRLNRTDYDPPDEDGYFEQIVWTAYEDHLNFARSLNDPRIEFRDGNDPDIYNVLLNLTKSALSDQLIIQNTSIDVDSLCNFVTSSEYGAISVFIGTTRNSFEEKKVIMLKYECYEEMALSEMRKLCHEARQKYPKIGKIAITHRIGEVPVTEKSVVIVTSSVHRKEAIHATEFLIDRLKATVPIWKKEIYEDDQSKWKENVEKF